MMYKPKAKQTVPTASADVAPLTVVGNGRLIWLFNRIELVVILYSDVMMLIISMCIFNVGMACHIPSYHTLHVIDK